MPDVKQYCLFGHFSILPPPPPSSSSASFSPPPPPLPSPPPLLLLFLTLLLHSGNQSPVYGRPCAAFSVAASFLAKTQLVPQSTNLKCAESGSSAMIVSDWNRRVRSQGSQMSCSVRCAEVGSMTTGMAQVKCSLSIAHLRFCRASSLHELRWRCLRMS
jgi:hypothetical protein